jgi:hypothetical protein
LNSALLLLIRSVSTSLLLLVNPAYMWYYAGGDFALYFAQKVARDDFAHFFPVEGLVGFIMCDVVAKVRARAMRARHDA